MEGLVDLEGGQVDLEAGQVDLEAGQVEMEAGQVDLEAGQVELEAGQVDLEAVQVDLEVGQVEMETGQVEVEMVEGIMEEVIMEEDTTDTVEAAHLDILANKLKDCESNEKEKIHTIKSTTFQNKCVLNKCTQ